MKPINFFLQHICMKITSNHFMLTSVETITWIFVIYNVKDFNISYFEVLLGSEYYKNNLKRIIHWNASPYYTALQKNIF